ncbi:MAG: diguanylate cyclase [Myxococcales bacterium]|nr:MAG: diguanylate cyclase [Myxococcales bacterium]
MDRKNVNERDIALRLACTVVNGIQDAAVIIDPSGKPLHFNNLYASMTGLRHRELNKVLRNGEQAYSLLGRTERQDKDTVQRCIESRDPTRLAEVEVRDATGKSHIVDLSFIPIENEKKDIIGLVQIIRDVSDDARLHGHYKDLLRLTHARAADLESLVEQRTRELSAALEEVTRLSLTDPLTGLLNRRAFVKYANKALDLAHRHNRSLAIMMCDLDRFKLVNDTFGHPAGDALLIASSNAIAGTLRTSDNVARMGGEEFSVLLTETHGENVREVATRCATAVKQLNVSEIINGASLQQTISVGVAIYPMHGHSIDKLISHADQALYIAKETGRDRVVVYDSELTIKDTAQKKAKLPRVLIVCTDDEKRTLLERCLSTGDYQITLATTPAKAAEACRDFSFDVIVADQNLVPTLGIDLLGGSMASCPQALRVLCIESRDLVFALKGSNLARVDSFILLEDVAESLQSTIDDGLTRRHLLREQIASGVALAKKAFSYRAEQLDTLLQSRELSLVYQPIKDIQNNRIFGFEALSRSQLGSHLGVGELFHAAVQTGKIWSLSRLVRSRVVEGIGDLPPDVKVFINLHPAEIEDPELYAKDSPLIPYAHRIVFEITEKTPITEIPGFQKRLTELRKNGYQIAIDDLGSGHASLNALTILEPDFVKLDMDLVRDIHKQPRRRRLLERIVQHALEEKLSPLLKVLNVKKKLIS